MKMRTIRTFGFLWAEDLRIMLTNHVTRCLHLFDNVLTTKTNHLTLSRSCNLLHFFQFQCSPNDHQVEPDHHFERLLGCDYNRSTNHVLSPLPCRKKSQKLHHHGLPRLLHLNQSIRIHAQIRERGMVRSQSRILGKTQLCSVCLNDELGQPPNIHLWDMGTLKVFLLFRHLSLFLNFLQFLILDPDPSNRTLTGPWLPLSSPFQR